MSILLKIYKFQVNSPIAIFWKYFCGINVFRGMLILTVNSIGSGLHLCTVWVANIISLGLVFFMYFLLRILRLIKNYFTKSLAFDAGRNWDHGRTRRWNNKFEETNLVGNVLLIISNRFSSSLIGCSCQSLGVKKTNCRLLFSKTRRPTELDNSSVVRYG